MRKNLAIASGGIRSVGLISLKRNKYTATSIPMV